MTEQHDAAAPAAAAPVTRELDWGQQRRAEAQLAMQMTLRRLDREPFAGARMREGQIAVEFADTVAAAVRLEDELAQYVQDLGANVVLAGDAQAGEVVNYAPWDTVIIAGAVPAQASLSGPKACCQIMEACAEVVRVLLATAIVAAYEEAETGEGVVVRLHSRPEVGGKVNLQTGVSAGLARVRCVVHTEREPRASYLLGTSYGEPKGHKLEWAFPMVEQIYGENRLRWRDLRSPDWGPTSAARKAVAS